MLDRSFGLIMRSHNRLGELVREIDARDGRSRLGWSVGVVDYERTSRDAPVEPLLDTFPLRRSRSVLPELLDPASHRSFEVRGVREPLVRQLHMSLQCAQ